MWSRKYTECQECKTTNFKFKAKWLCTSCYDKQRAKKRSRQQQINKAHKKRYYKNQDNQEVLESRRADYRRYYDKNKEVITLSKKARYRKRNWLPHMIMRVNWIEYPLPFETINSNTDEQYVLLKDYYENLQIKN